MAEDGRMRAETVKAILDDRTARLARREDAAPLARQDNDDALLVCAVGDELYALSVGQVTAVVTWRAPSPVPGSPPGVLGLIADRAVTYNLADLGTLLGAGAPQGGRRDGMLLLLRHHRPRVALAVDRVLRVTSSYLPVMDGERPASAPEATTAFLREPVEARGFALLDMDMLLKPLLELATKQGAH